MFKFITEPIERWWFNMKYPWEEHLCDTRLLKHVSRCPDCGANLRKSNALVDGIYDNCLCTKCRALFTHVHYGLKYVRPGKDNPNAYELMERFRKQREAQEELENTEWYVG